MIYNFKEIPGTIGLDEDGFPIVDFTEFRDNSWLANSSGIYYTHDDKLKSKDANNLEFSQFMFRKTCLKVVKKNQYSTKRFMIVLLKDYMENKLNYEILEIIKGENDE